MESLIYYGLVKDGKYFNTNFDYSYSMFNIKLFENLSVAESVANVEHAQVNKFKIHDLGRAEE